MARGRKGGMRTGRGTYGVDESAEVQEDGVEGYDAHGLQGVAVDDVGCYGRVAHLDARGD